jgi:hypothetical protein
MIRRRDPGHFGMTFLNFIPTTAYLPQDSLAGPIILSIALFGAVLANFVIRGEYTYFFHNK